MAKKESGSRAKSARATNRGKSGAARDAAARKEARKAMVVGTPAPGPVDVDLDVDPTVISTPELAPDHPVGELDEHVAETTEQVINGATGQGTGSGDAVANAAAAAEVNAAEKPSE